MVSGDGRQLAALELLIVGDWIMRTKTCGTRAEFVRPKNETGQYRLRHSVTGSKMKYVFSALALVVIVSSVSCSPREDSAPEQADSRNACTAPATETVPAPEVAPGPVNAEDASIELLIRVLGSEHGTIRAAINELARRREAAIPALVEAIDHGSTMQRRWALRAFWRMRPAPDSGSAIPAIVNAMTDPDGFVRYEAGRALSHFGPKAKAAVPQIMAMLKDPKSKSELRYDAIRVLPDIGPDTKAALGVLVESLDDKEAEVRNASLFAISELGGLSDESMIPRLIEFLDDEETTSNACLVLGCFGKEGVPPIRALLKDKSPEKRKSALEVLGLIGVAAREALPDVVKMLSDKVPEVRVQACEAIIAIDPPGKAGRDKLLEFINDQESDAREAAILCWTRVNRNDVGALQGMANALKDRRPGVRSAAAFALFIFAPEARNALPTLKMAFDKESSGRVAFSAMSDAIESIGGREWTPGDKDRLGAYERGERIFICVYPWLGTSDDTGEVAVTPVRMLLKAVSPVRRKAALKVLAEIGPSAGGALPDFVRMLSDANHKIRREACAMVVAMDLPGGTVGLDELSELLNDREFQAGQSPIKYWTTANPKDTRSLRNLANALKDRRATVRFAAANVLGVMGPVARDALPALKTAIHDDINGDVRAAMREALKRIGGEKKGSRSLDNLLGPVIE